MQAVQRYTAAYWASSNPVLGLDVEGIESDTKRVKYGDNETAWNDLPYSGFKRISRHLIVDDSECCCFDFDYGSFTNPNNNTPIEAGSFLSPAVNFWLDLCHF